jgi:hypothetical protein
MRAVFVLTSDSWLLREVFTSFEFDLCPACQKDYVSNPLPAVAK